ncbi:MAG: hypothetical protein QOJ39_3787 [Candidatus Eremiobacteraeota bacterium]|jgi:hypothetical protein|nr:hypothetical protein [Candidatus Eremiobacteraeota bacterium]
MDREALEYSRHARDKMSTSGIFEDDVEGTVDWPTRRCRTYDERIEHFGYSSDGRVINVVTDQSERYVITVIDVNKRSRERLRRKR